ncbi:MAG: acyclic terpene utilization AtuA family protein [Betaproteobacteria bacterium]|nr:acyclic terpene utilization AtuA family protein [Betaproteobacteria bacterium]
MSRKVFIGCGAGFSGDRIDAAVPVVRTLSRLDGERFLIYEVLAERTLAIAQKLRRDDPDKGYSPFLDAYLSRVLADCHAHGIRIVTNMGAANPLGAAKRVQALAAELGVRGLRVAAVTGDDLLATLSEAEILAHPRIEGLDPEVRKLVAANAYMGARPIAEALATGAHVVLVGRTTDAALSLGPLVHVHGWGENDLDLLAQGTVCGHLLECGAQVTGAYFADPGFKDVDDLAHVGFPIAEVDAHGELLITKAADTGGLVDRATVIEQLLYEVHDPRNYLTPDVTLDLGEVTVDQVGLNRVQVSGARGKEPPATLKATVCFDAGWLGEGEITYSGPNALARARLAASVVRTRCTEIGITERVRVDVLGTQAVFDGDAPQRRPTVEFPADGEYRVRAAARSAHRHIAQQVADEVLSLYCSGPAAGAGVRQNVTAQIGTASILVDRAHVTPGITVVDAS